MPMLITDQNIINNIPNKEIIKSDKNQEPKLDSVTPIAIANNPNTTTAKNEIFTNNSNNGISSSMTFTSNITKVILHPHPLQRTQGLSVNAIKI